jgi:predicted transcriptional regulator
MKNKINRFDGGREFSCISNRLINTPGLTSRAKGVLLYFLSKPQDWQFYENDIFKHFKDGRHSVRAGIKELMVAGYVHRRKVKDAYGHFVGYEYDIYDSPKLTVRVVHDAERETSLSGDQDKYPQDDGRGDMVLPQSVAGDT